MDAEDSEVFQSGPSVPKVKSQHPLLKRKSNVGHTRGSFREQTEGPPGTTAGMRATGRHWGSRTAAGAQKPLDARDGFVPKQRLT